MGPCRNKAIYRYSRVDQACSSSRGCGRDKQRSKGHDGSKSRKVHRQGKISLRCSIRDSILALQTLKESWRFVGDTRRFLGVCYVQVLSLRPPGRAYKTKNAYKVQQSLFRCKRSCPPSKWNPNKMKDNSFPIVN